MSTEAVLDPRPARVPATRLSVLVDWLRAAGADVEVRPDPGAVEVSGLTLDSRAVRPGDLYAALPGASTHGARFAAGALELGAVAVLTDPEGHRLLGEQAVPVLVAERPRRLLGGLAAEVYGRPAEHLLTIGVTGTQGKTTVTYLLEAALRGAGHVPGLMGTTGSRVDGRPVASRLTTPEAPDLHALLAVMREAGVDACALEVSSHALVQGRVDGVVFDVAVFLNLGRDHLDFHRDIEDYFAAKADLFTPQRARRAVVDMGDPWGRRLAAETTLPLVTCTTQPDVEADWRAVDVVVGPLGSELVALGPGGRRVPLRLPLPGAFNVRNALAVVAALDAAGVDVEAAAAGLADRCRRPRPDGAGGRGPGLPRPGRLRAQARRGRGGALGRAPGDDRPTGAGDRGGGRPRPGQATADGRGGGAAGRRPGRHRRQPAQRGPWRDPRSRARRSGRAGRRRRDRRPGRGDRARGRRSPPRATPSWSPARGTSPDRRSPASCTPSTTGTWSGPRCARARRRGRRRDRDVAAGGRRRGRRAAGRRRARHRRERARVHRLTRRQPGRAVRRAAGRAGRRTRLRRCRGGRRGDRRAGPARGRRARGARRRHHARARPAGRRRARAAHRLHGPGAHRLPGQDRDQGPDRAPAGAGRRGRRHDRVAEQRVRGAADRPARRRRHDVPGLRDGHPRSRADPLPHRHRPAPAGTGAQRRRRAPGRVRDAGRHRAGQGRADRGAARRRRRRAQRRRPAGRGDGGADVGAGHDVRHGRRRGRTHPRAAHRRRGQTHVRAGDGRRLGAGRAAAARRPPGVERRGRGRRRPRPRPAPGRGRRPALDRGAGVAVADGAARAGRRRAGHQRRLQRQPRLDALRPRDAGGRRSRSRRPYGRGARRDARARRHVGGRARGARAGRGRAWASGSWSWSATVPGTCTPGLWTPGCRPNRCRSTTERPPRPTSPARSARATWCW